MTDTLLLLNELLAYFNSNSKLAMKIYHPPYLKRLVELEWIEVDSDLCYPSAHYYEVSQKLSLSHLEQIFLAGLE